MRVRGILDRLLARGKALLSSRRYATLISGFMFLILYWLDIQLGVGYSFAALYCVPIALVVWHWGKKFGVLAALVGLIAELHDFPMASISSVSGAHFAFQSFTDIGFYTTAVLITTKFRSYTDRLTQLGKSYEKLAFYDRLTGLPNRLLLLDRMAVSISQARRERRNVLILYMDLDGFKVINDVHGHDTGDDVLRAIAERFKALVRDGDTVARVGGDEFVVVLGNVQCRDEATEICRKFIAALAPPVATQHAQHNLGVSIGISVFPDDGAEIDSLLSSADAAMYASKNAGKNTFTYFNSSGRTAVSQIWLVLDSEYEVGVDEIDAQHQELVRLANRLNVSIEQGDAEGCRRGFDEMVNFTKFHFATEERYMEHSGYPHTRAHTRAHEKLIEDIELIRLRLQEGSELMALQTIKDWIFQHIETADKRLGQHLHSNAG